MRGRCASTLTQRGAFDPLATIPKAPAAWDGDSVIFGTGGGTVSAPPVQLGTLAGISVDNFGVPSSKTSDCAIRWSNEIRGRGYRTLLWSCAVNDVANGISGTTALANATVVWNQAKADGLKVIITEVTPWKNSAGWTTGTQTESDVYSTGAKAWADANGGVFIFTRPTMGGQGGDTNVLLTTMNSGDNIHPNVAGQLELATRANTGGP